LNLPRLSTVSIMRNGFRLDSSDSNIEANREWQIVSAFSCD
jgi:hypothetical protein